MSLNTAEQLEENEQYDKAYEEYKKIYSQKPKDVDLLQRLGHLAIMLDKKDAAIEYYSKILEVDATSILAYEQLMDLYMNTDRYKYYIARGNLHTVQEELSHAVGDFKKALDKAQTEEEINTTRFILANLYEQTGKSHQAIDEYLRILDTSAINELVFLQLAKIYVEEDSIGSAIGILERARENDFDTDTVKENLAQLYLRYDQPEKARELTKDELVKVKSLLDEEKNQAAFEILDAIKDDYKKNAQYHLLLAQYYFNTKNWDLALESVNEFDKFEKNSPLTYQMRALIYEEKGSEFEAHINWAKYNLLRKDRDVALNDYLSAYQLNEGDPVLVRDIAELIEEMGDKTHAAEFWEKLINLEPNSKRALEKVADFREDIGDYRSEIEVLEKWYAFDNKSTVVLKKLAKSYEKIRNKEKALEFYKKFVSLSPINDDYNLAKVKIQKLESSGSAEYEESDGLIDKIMRMFGKK